MQPQIFLSYSWRNKDIADAIDNDWQAVGITMIRDVRDMEYKGNLKDFMKRVHESDFVLLLISKDYLESKNCMYEALEMFDDPDFTRKILPILTDDARISDPFARIKYLEYWEDKKRVLDEGYRGMKSATRATSIANELDHYDKIRKTWDSFADQIQSILCAMWPHTQEIGYADIFNHIGFNKDETNVLEECSRIITLDDPEEQELALNDLKARFPNNFSVAFTFSSVAYRAKRYKICRSLLEKIIADYPSSHQARNNLSILLSNEFKQYADARNHLEKALEIYPAYVSAHVNLGILLGDHFGEYEEALSHFEKAVEIEPSNPDAHTQLALTLAERFNEEEEARSHYQRALELDDDSFIATYGFARLMDKMGDSEKARELYNRALDIEPDNIEALNSLGILLSDKFGLFTGSQQHFEYALALKPDDYATNHNLAHLLTERMQRPADGIEYMRKIVRMRPESVTALEDLALALENHLHSHEEAKGLYEQALALNPDSLRSLTNLASILTEYTPLDVAKAHQLLTHALKVAPNDCDTEYNYAILLANHLGEHDQAKAHLERALDLNPDSSNAHAALAGLLTKQYGLFDAARQHYERALELDFEDDNTHHNLGTILAKHYDQYASARHHFERALQFNPSRADTLLNLGAILVDQFGELGPAHVCFERALDLNPNFAAANFNMALLIAKQPGDEAKAKAKVYYLRACELDPNLQSVENDRVFER
jgi:tetratricopeptide (TPR) repeat protein